MGLPMDVNPADVTQAGWAVVFPTQIHAEVREALQPLISQRQKQIPTEYCRELEHEKGEGVEGLAQAIRSLCGKRSAVKDSILL